MRVFKKVEAQVEELDEVICNMCGEKVEKDLYGNFADFVEVNKIWGYNSGHDGENHCFDLCEKCYNNFIDNFKIPVK